MRVFDELALYQGRHVVLTDLLKFGQAEVKADACIVGAGPAGISLALELARMRPEWRVLLMEGGGRGDASERERALYDVQVGEKPYAVEASRRRLLGGTSAHWGGWCRPLDPTDHVVPADWSTTPWPFGPEQLAPYLADASRWCEIPSDDYSVAPIETRHSGALLDLDGAKSVATGLFRFSPPTRFGSRYLPELEAQQNLTCILKANLVGVEREGERITAARFRALDGPTLRVSATHFVLALGGIENARILLNLRGDGAADGIGISSPHLGRHFADHYGLRPGFIFAPAELTYRRFADGSDTVMPVLTPSTEALRNGSMQNHCIMLDAQPTEAGPGAGYGGQQSLGFRPGRYWVYGVQMILEPRPNPESRIELANERCELGWLRARLEWKPHPRDFETAYEFFEQLGAELAGRGLGRVRLTSPDSPALRAGVSGAYHHMGTTRMADDPRDGVVDGYGRVHDLRNLHVAGSSVFCRYGHANPTLTIVALSLRLARHLSEGRDAT
jgi:choline dehydrogenase-like flavoprotein